MKDFLSCINPTAMYLEAKPLIGHNQSQQFWGSANWEMHPRLVWQGDKAASPCYAPKVLPKQGGNTCCFSLDLDISV